MSSQVPAPAPAPRIARPALRHRAFAALALATALVVPAGSPPDAAVAAAPRSSTLELDRGSLRSAGRAALRDVARMERAAGVTDRGGATIPRLAWPRAGTGPTGGGESPGQREGPGSAGGAGSAAAADRAVPAAAAGDATASGDDGATAPADLTPQDAVGGPGVDVAWNGLTDQAIPCGSSRPCREPADPWVAVSAGHVVQSVNASTRITTRDGRKLLEVSNASFFGVAAFGASAIVADPRVLFDPAHDRWIASLFAGTCSAGALFLAVSRTADPTGDWDRWFEVLDGRWPDYPTLGHSSSLVAVGANEYSVSCGTGGAPRIGAYRGTSLRLVDWADLLDGGGAPEIVATTPLATAFTFAPAAGLTAGDTLHAVVALADGSDTRADLGYVAVTGTVGGGDLAVAAPNNLSTSLDLPKLADPPTPVDRGGLIGVQRNALDLRPTDAVWRAGRLAIASTNRCLVGSSTRPCARVTELETGGAAPTLRQDLRIGPTSGYTDTFVPGVGYADDGTLWVAYSQSGANRYVSAWVRRQLHGDAAGAWSTGSGLVAAGRGPYGGTAGAGLNQRWGDYVGVARDPADPTSTWQANQLADTGGGWATRVAKLGDDAVAPTISEPRPSFVSGSTAGSSGIPLRISWSALDAGSGVARVRLERSVNGGAWTAVTLTSTTATSATLTLSYARRYAFRVAATDNAGNTTDWLEGPAFTPTLLSQGSSAVRYSGFWATSRSSKYLGGSTRYTATKGRRATLSFTGIGAAWISVAGPTRGSARVTIDGRFPGTYSTYRSSTAYRRVVAGRTFTTAVPRTYRVEVLGTRGHSRIDIDGFVVLR